MHPHLTPPLFFHAFSAAVFFQTRFSVQTLAAALAFAALAAFGSDFSVVFGCRSRIGVQFGNVGGVLIGCDCVRRFAYMCV